MRDFGIFFKGYKSYKQDIDHQIDSIYPINVLIGRNNSGKSSILDIIDFCTNGESLHKANLHPKSIEQVGLSLYLNDEDLTLLANSNNSIHQYRKSLLGKKILISLTNSTPNSLIFEKVFYKLFDFDETKIPSIIKFCKHNQDVNGFNNKTSLRIRADRDISPEIENNLPITRLNDLKCAENGNGATTIIHKFINLATLDRNKVKVDLLNALNMIMKPDAVYSDIFVQQIDVHPNLLWEIYLEEASGLTIPLSKCGSGLKTIILVLINLILLPIIKNKQPSQIIYGFEELENNLHPALQRNLFSYLQNWIIDNQSTLFLTTHSNVAIDLYGNCKESQIFHIDKDKDGSKIVKVENYLNKVNILNDLDVRASDILQSNGIIWVEGPSDRIYINRWIELVSDNKLKENQHYQIMFYGGKLLSHLEASDNETISESDLSKNINLLLLNRNSAIVIDSDKKSAGEDIRDTKKRVQTEFDKLNCLCWITAGKEIENYLSTEIVQTALKEENRKPANIFNQFEKIDEYFESIVDGVGKKFTGNKVKYANSFSELITLDNMENRFDLKEKIILLVDEIKKWNSID